MVVICLSSPGTGLLQRELSLHKFFDITVGHHHMAASPDLALSLHHIHDGINTASCQLFGKHENPVMGPEELMADRFG